MAEICAVAPINCNFLDCKARLVTVIYCVK